MPPMRPQRGKTPRKRTKTNTQTDPVEVYCRVRPLDNVSDVMCVKVENSTTVTLLPSENSALFARTGQLKEYQYKFQQVFDEFSAQKCIFDVVALPLVEDLIHGKNGLLFTYGITSSGKTYTMTGTPQDQGVLPRCLDVLFNSIEGLQSKKYVFKPDRMNGFEIQSDADAMLERQKRDYLPGLTPRTPGTPRGRDRVDFGGEMGRLTDPSKVGDIDQDNTYSVFVSYIEIYNNYIYDLLEELPYDNITGYKPPQSKILRTDGTDNMYVMNCTEVEIKSPDEAFEILYKGQKRRKVAHTALNAESSRSHSIFNIRLVQAPLDPMGEDVLNDQICVSQLSLVDLAGSERAVRTKNHGERLKEAGNINQTLMALRNCMEILRENQKINSNKMVPYRDSKLTHLFKTYFDGDGKVRMIVCINPKIEEYDETMFVMKFAELSQEVLVARSQQVKFDLGLTPGRRRLNAQLKESKSLESGLDTIASPTVTTYSLGPPFPLLELHDPHDDDMLAALAAFLGDRYNRRQTLLIDLETRQDQFRARLVEFEKNYQHMLVRNEELENVVNKRDGNMSKLESRCRNLEQKVTSLQRQLHEVDKARRELEVQLQDKNLKIHQEKSEKNRMRDDFRHRLEANNNQWERNLEKERQKVEKEYVGQIRQMEGKFSAFKDMLDTEADNFKTPQTPKPKTRTYTTPGVIQTARSESDVSSIGSTPVAPPRSRTNSSYTPTSRTNFGYRSKIPPPVAPRTTPLYNLRHRRSRSNGEVWLDHQPSGSVQLDTILQPKLKKKKSVSKLQAKDTQSANKYMLTHQDQGSDGEFQTKFYKGDMIPTVGGGTAVVFNDVEVRKQKSPGTRKRRSSCPQPQDFDGEWTDTEERCNIAIEGHGLVGRKRSRPSPPDRESRV